MIYSSVLGAIGRTPIVELQRVGKHAGCRILVKLENLNPGGSVKSRTANWMVECALKKGLIDKDSILIEATSGNQGIGVAMVGAVLGMKVRIIMPESMSHERQLFMRAYGAEVILTPEGKDIKETIQILLDTAKKMEEEDPRVFWTNQFCNMDNPDVHRLTTAKEILDDVEAPIDAFVSGIGTGGTVTGIGQVLKSRYPDCMIVAAEPENAPLLSGGKMGNHIQQGIGDGVMPDVLDSQVVDKLILVSDDDAIETARSLASKEGLFVGISSGTNVWAAIKAAEEMGPGKTIVALLPDSGDRYLSCGLVEEQAEDPALQPQSS
jgi:cysteine synthase A